MNSHISSKAEAPANDHHSPASNQPRDIRKRTFDFAVRIVKLCRFLEKNMEVSPSLVSQLLRSGTSIGANVEEAAAGESRADFIHKNAISLKEARESRYWLRLLSTTEYFSGKERIALDELLKESDELARILGKIVYTSRKNSKK